jgi:photosystem II stability/assembly factor-like uncharacterized protein
MARLSRTTRLIGALMLLGALGLGFTLLRLAEDPWEFLGPAEGDVTSLVFDPTTPTTLYAATDYGGVYKSEDGGTTWRYLRGSRELEEGFLAIAPTTPATLYVYGRGVYKSADGGETWRAVNRGLGLIWVSALSIDPTNPRVVFAGTRNGVYKSTDGGESWRAVNRGLELGEGNWVSALSVDPTNPRVVFAGTRNGVYKSDDGGETWGRISTWRANALSIDPANPQVIVAAVSDGVLRSADGGETWRSADGLPAKDVSSLLRAPTGVMYATNARSLYRSADGGATWSEIEVATPVFRPGSLRSFGRVSLRLLAVDPTAPATLYAERTLSRFSGGLWRSSDGGVSWQPAGLGSIILSLAQTPSALYVGTYMGGVYRSDDRGLTWRAASDGLTGFDIFALAVDPTTPTILYAATDNGVHKSNNGGATWHAAGLPGQWVLTLAVDPTTPTTLYAGVGYSDEPGVYKSTDGGETWRAAGLSGQSVQALAVDPTTPTTLYAATDNGVYKSDDGGLTWRAVGLPGRSVQSLAIHPIEPATLFAGTNDNGDNALFRSTDGGATWSESIKTGIFGISAVVIDPNAPATVYAASEMLLRSTDGGATWSREKGSSLFRRPMSLLLVTDPAQPPAIYASTGGVWRLAIDKARWAPYPSRAAGGSQG